MCVYGWPRGIERKSAHCSPANTPHAWLVVTVSSGKAAQHWKCAGKFGQPMQKWEMGSSGTNKKNSYPDLSVLVAPDPGQRKQVPGSRMQGCHCMSLWLPKTAHPPPTPPTQPKKSRDLPGVWMQTPRHWPCWVWSYLLRGVYLASMPSWGTQSVPIPKSHIWQGIRSAFCPACRRWRRCKSCRRTCPGVTRKK